MIGLTSYRDYFASSKQGRSSKYESLCQYMADLEELLGENVVGVPTCSVGKTGSYDEYDSLLVFEHPTSLLQKITTGFTTPNVNQHFVQLEKLFAYNKDILSCNLEFTNTERWIRSVDCRRRNPKTSIFNIPSDDEFRAFFKRALSQSYTDGLRNLRQQRSDFAIGDSHTAMLWKPRRTVEAMYGRTLHRSLKEGLSTLVSPSSESVIFCFGNIDLRHHLGRQGNPLEATEQLAKEYARQAIELDCDVSICELLPVISEERMTIKSYWYKDAPYYGSAVERTALRAHFNKTLTESAGESLLILSTPKEFYDESGLLRDEVIETTKGGIHISPFYYEMTAAKLTNKPENAWLP